MNGHEGREKRNEWVGRGKDSQEMLAGCVLSTKGLVVVALNQESIQ